jgi:hypothetical protein
VAESAFHWQDGTRKFIKRADIQKFFDFLGEENFQRDPKDVVDAMVSIVPACFATWCQRQRRIS